jgi:hypothetical protein
MNEENEMERNEKTKMKRNERKSKRNTEKNERSYFKCFTSISQTSPLLPSISTMHFYDNALL